MDNQKQESPTDTLGKFRRIILYTQMINYMAYGLESVNKNFEKLLAQKPDIPLGWAKEEQDEMLQYTVDQLGEIANRLANYLEGCDGLDKDDLSILNPVFELLKLNPND